MSDFDKVEVANRLKPLPFNVAAQVYQIAESQVVAETQRQKRIDSKAVSLLLAVGLFFLVLASTLFQGWKFAPDWARSPLAGITIFTALVLGKSGACFLQALNIRKYGTTSASAVFGRGSLRT